MLRRLLKLPHWLFLLFAAPIGLVLCALVPPMGGGNEMYNFQRAAGIAYGHALPGAAEVPGGIADLIAEGFAYFHENLAFPISFPEAEQRRMAAIALQADRPAVLAANPIAVHHPVSYLPQALAIRLGAMADATPLTLFYLARIAGLLGGLALTFLAIRTMPSHRFALCALALLPPITFGRSMVDADPVTNGLAFLFVAAVLREMLRRDAVEARALSRLALLAFLVGQSKSAYLVLLVLAVAIPGARFPTLRSRLGWMALLMLPGMIASLGWMLLVKETVLSGTTYVTASGGVDPDGQLAFILSHPLDYAATFLRTLFTTRFFPWTLFQFAGLFGPPVVLPVTLAFVILALLLGVVLSDAAEAPGPYPASLPWLTAAIFAGFIGLTMTLLYLQWTALGAPLIDGFQGRYLFPLLPLVLVLSRAKRPAFGVAPSVWLLAQASLGLAALLWKAHDTYYH
ncbi:DUF2142 domain-containing protein [Dongia sp. agr-C8]